MRKETTTRLLIKADALDVELISKEKAEEYLPDRIMDIDGYRHLLEDKSDEEIKITLLAKQTLHLKTIRSIVIFFLVMWLIGAAVSASYIFKIVSVLY